MPKNTTAYNNGISESHIRCLLPTYINDTDNIVTARIATAIKKYKPVQIDDAISMPRQNDFLGIPFGVFAKKTMLTTNQAISIAGIANTNKRSNNETKPVIIKPPHFV